MPYVLMSKHYEYDDERYLEQERGFPELIFADDETTQADATLEQYRIQSWLQVTPLDDYYPNDSLEEMSSRGLDDAAIASAISTVLGEPLTPEAIRHLDFRTKHMSPKQLEQVAKLLDRVTGVYLLTVRRYEA